MTASYLRHVLSRRPNLDLGKGVDSDTLARAEQQLGYRLPNELADFLTEVSGVFDREGQWYVGWPIDRLIEENRRLESDEGFPPGLVAFGDDGTGAPFCISIEGAKVVFSYSPIEARIWPLANDLAEFWSGWVAGTITT